MTNKKSSTPCKGKSRFVNPAVGVNRGKCLIGPYRPCSLVRLGPDAEQPSGAYKTGRPVVGFSHTHLPGGGGIPRYGNIRLMPFTGKMRYNETRPFFHPHYRRREDAVLKNEHAELGYYSARQEYFDVDIELTSTAHVGAHRYTFSNGNDAQVFLDAGALLQDGGYSAGEIALFQAWEQGPESTGGFLEQVDSRTLRGRSDFTGGWGNAMPYSIFFQVEFNTPIQYIQFANRGGIVPAGEMKLVAGPQCISALGFGKKAKIEVRVGISLVSIANAENSLRKESDGKSFDDIRAESVAEWETILSRFDISGGTEDQKILFYSLLYRLYSQPTDLGTDQENPFWKSGIRSFTDYCCLWDSVRNANSFYNLFDPELARDIMNSLLDIADHSGGWLPDSHLSLRHAHMQSACAADIIFSEAARKGVTGVDYRKALVYTRKNSEEISPDPAIAGRYTEDWQKQGYLTTDHVPKASVSRHIEYAFHDWCIARLAEFLGDHKTETVFDRNAERVWNLWDKNNKIFMPKNLSGEIVCEGDPWHTEPEGYNSVISYEAPASAWTMNVFNDFAGLFDRLGGREASLERLDWLFSEGVWFHKETMMHVPHLYTLLGEPARSAERVAKILRDSYQADANGLYDDEDFGCQSGFYLWNSLGLYPLIGHTIYLLVPPLFDRMTLKTGTGILTIECDRSAGSAYIIGMNLNGKKLDRAWVTHKELSGNAKLQFTLADKSNNFGRTELPFELQKNTSSKVK